MFIKNVLPKAGHFLVVSQFDFMGSYHPQLAERRSQKYKRGPQPWPAISKEKRDFIDRIITVGFMAIPGFILSPVLSGYSYLRTRQGRGSLVATPTQLPLKGVHNAPKLSVCPPLLTEAIFFILSECPHI